MTERLRVRIPAGVAGEFSSPGSTFCADSYFLLPEQHVNDPCHSTKCAGGRLQLKHACILCMWLCMK